MKRNIVSSGVAVILVAVPVFGFVFSQDARVAGEERIYSVQPKDTLWGIAGKFYANPFEWKRIHAANPGIKNPDLIFPGEKIVVPGKAVAPAETVAPEGKTVPVTEIPVEEPEITGSENAAQVPAAENSSLPEDKAESAAETPETVVRVEEKKEVPLSREKTLRMKFTPGTLLVPVDWQYDGVITQEEEEKILISAGDTIHLNIGSRKGLRKGMYCFVYRKGKKAYHSETGKLQGMNIDRIGIIDIIETKENTSSAKVITSSEALGVGDGIKIE